MERRNHRPSVPPHRRPRRSARLGPRPHLVPPALVAWAAVGLVVAVLAWSAGFDAAGFDEAGFDDATQPTSGLVFAGAGVVASETAPACGLVLDPEVVAAGRPDAVIGLVAGSTVGPARWVVVEPESGLRILRVEAHEGARLEVHLDTRGAREGAWSLSVEGEQGVCRGRLEVRGGSV